MERERPTFGHPSGAVTKHLDHAYFEHVLEDEDDDVYREDDLQRSDVGEDVRYVVYLPDAKLIATYRTTEILKRLSQHRFQLFYFKDNDTLKKKIRLKKID